MTRKSLPLLLLFCAFGSEAQDRIYRCGNEYTNTVARERLGECVLISGANVTVVPALKTPSSTGASNSVQGKPANQRAKDVDARTILESELSKARVRKLELSAEYNHGEPEKLGSETRNNQKYLDRVADIKAKIQSNDADIASISRELARINGSLNASSR